MPTAQTNSTINARRFAALLAGFDTSNGSEEEALAKGRALRRIAADAGMRIVDAMELPEVKRAIDDQLRPTRTESPALREALEQAASAREELTERTRDVRKLAELLRRQEERAEELSRALAVSRRVRGSAQRASVASAPVPAGHAAVRLPGVEPWAVVLTAVLALTLLIASIFGGHFHETGGNGNGVGNGQGVSASRVHEGRAVRAVRKHRAVRHRLRRGGASDRTR